LANCSPWRARGEKPSARNAAKQQIGSCGILPRRRGSARSHDIADTQGAIIDLHMFVAVGGRERSVSQYEHLLRQADLSMTATTPLPSGYVLMEVVARTSARPHIFGAWFPDASAWPHGGSPIMSSCNPEFIQTTQPSFDDVPASGAMEDGGACNKHAKLQAGVRHLHRRVRKGPLGALRSTMEISRSSLPIMIVASEELTGSHADRYQNIAIARRTGSSYPRLPHRSGDRRLQSILPGTLA
jgi:hypothetical protein